MCWSNDNNQILTHDKQHIVIFELPDPNSIDTSSSFQIEANQNMIRFLPETMEIQHKASSHTNTHTNTTEHSNDENNDKKATKSTTESEEINNKSSDNSEHAKEEQIPEINLFEENNWSIAAVAPYLDTPNDILVAVKSPGCNYVSFLKIFFVYFAHKQNYLSLTSIQF